MFTRTIDQAFPELCHKAREELALVCFLAFKSLQMLIAMQQCRPRSVMEAVQTVLELESYSQSSQCHKISFLTVNSEEPINRGDYYGQAPKI